MVILVVAVSTLIIIASYIDAYYIGGRRNDFYRSNALISAVFQILDLVSDVFFCLKLLSYEPKYLFIAAAAFIVLPITLSIGQLYVAVQQWRSLGKDTVTTWLLNYSYWLYALSLLTGSAFSGTQICRSDMFGLPQFGLPLNDHQIIGFQSKKLWSTVMLEVECNTDFTRFYVMWCVTA